MLVILPLKIPSSPRWGDFALEGSREGGDRESESLVSWAVLRKKLSDWLLREVNPSDVIILEGILILHDPRVRELMNMKIFVDTDSDLRLARRLKRDAVERSRCVQNVLDQYTKFVKPSFEEFILPSMKYAYVIIPRAAENEVAIDLIVQHIHTKLGQHDLCKIHPNVSVIYSTFHVSPPAFT